MRTTIGRVGGVLYALLAVVVCAGLALGTGLASTRIPPGVAGVPASGGEHLVGPSTLDEGDPEAIENIVYEPAILQCHRWASEVMTQSRHPRSPACVSGWDDAEGNGGSTAPGVDGSVIRIGVPGRVTRHYAVLEDYFNSRYEFYGRSVKFIPLGPVDSLAAQRASIAMAGNQEVFAAIGVDASNDRPLIETDTWLSGLAAQGIIGVVAGGVASDSTLSSSGPYSWSIAPTEDQLQRYLGKLVCETLAGSPARFSSEFAHTPRTFATLGPGEGGDSWDIIDPQVLGAAARDCGIEIGHYEYSHVSQDPGQAARDQMMYQQMKDDGITTVIVLGSAALFAEIVPTDMEAVGYRPEFVSVERNVAYWFVAPAEQQRGVIGIRPGPPPQAAFAPPLMTALIESGYTRAQLEDVIGGYHGEALDIMTVIAAGIQNAGPDLTPQSFAAGLEASRFPNPTDTESWGRGGIGLQVGDHVLERDVALGWFDPDNMTTIFRETAATPGRACLILDGERFALTDDFPADDTAFHDLSRDCQGPGTTIEDQP
ncbi:MAG: hypothetical protein Q4G67_00720 [Actinomycetia bacterium]|nr:hypothetical protein [Actinomycetes bacterium]